MKRKMYNLVYALKKRHKLTASSRTKTVFITDSENVPKQAIKLRDEHNFNLQITIQ